LETGYKKRKKKVRRGTVIVIREREQKGVWRGGQARNGVSAKKGEKGQYGMLKKYTEKATGWSVPRG